MSTPEKSKIKYCELILANGKVVIPYEFKRQRNIRYLRVTINDTNRVTLKAPWKCSENKAIEFLQSQGDWVIKTLKKIPKRRTIREFIKEKGYLTANGVKLSIEIINDCAKTHTVFDYAQKHMVLLLKKEEEEESELRRILKGFAREVLPQRANFLANKMNLSIEKVTIRDQRTMWGSCTDRATLSLNWRLIFLKPELQDHIILHELTHLTHLNHSRDFYTLLEKYDPQATMHDHKISKISPEIMQLGREKMD